jgi:hypothetical protein
MSLDTFNRKINKVAIISLCLPIVLSLATWHTPYRYLFIALIYFVALINVGYMAIAYYKYVWKDYWKIVRRRVPPSLKIK